MSQHRYEIKRGLQSARDLHFGTFFRSLFSRAFLAE